MTQHQPALGARAAKRSPRAAQPTVVTANALRSGSVVYLTADGRWAEQLNDAAVAASMNDLGDLETFARSAVERCEVTAVYAFPVRVVSGQAEPVSVRERIRAARSPSV